MSKWNVHMLLTVNPHITYYSLLFFPLIFSQLFARNFLPSPEVCSFQKH